MIETAVPKWQQVIKLPDEHRIFKLDGREDKLALADNSGDTPDQTDDGVLWLDRARPLSVRDDGGCSIPLLDSRGAETRTPTDARTLLVLSARYEWPVQSRFGKLYLVTEQGRS